MIAEEYLRRSRLFRRLKSGPHGQLVELYATRLVKDGLARQGTWRCLSLVGDLLSLGVEQEPVVVVRVHNPEVGPPAGDQDHRLPVRLDPGGKVLVTAKLPTASFVSEGRPYGYFDGLTGTAEIRVRREPIIVTLIPALRQVFQ